MSAPLKNVSVLELEKALASALFEVAGKTVNVSVKSLDFDEETRHVAITLWAFDKVYADPYVNDRD